MNLETTLKALEADFEIVAFELHNGKGVKCITQGAVRIPIDKITVYGLGQVQFPEEKELSQLKNERGRNQRAFATFSKPDRLKVLERRQRNQTQSLGNLRSLVHVGMSNSIEDIKTIISHALAVGATVEVSTAGGLMYRSELDALRGPLTVLSGWKILDDGTKLMTTIKFIPPKP